MADLSQQIALRTAVAHDLEVVQRVLLEARNRAHILTPFARTNIPLVPDGWDIYFHQYKISTEKDDEGKYRDNEVYPVEGTNRLALTKIGLWRLEQLAGVSWEEPRTGRSTIIRMDDAADPLVCRYSATGYIRDIDGQIRSQSDGFGYDLRDDAPQAKARSQKRLDKDRQNIEQLTITKAKLRVLRAMLGLQSSYKPEEFEKPFVVLKMQFSLDRLDPEIKRKLDTIMAAKQMGIEKELFGLEAAHMHRLTEPANPPPPLPPVSPPLNLPPVSDPIEDDADAMAERKYLKDRATKISRIEELYLAKKGMPREKLSPDKPALVELTDASLGEIEEALAKLPDLKPQETKKDII